MATDIEGDFLDQLFDALPCPGEACDVTAGTPVEVLSNSATRGVDFSLDRGGAIEGVVTDTTTGFGVAEILVEISDHRGYEVGHQHTDEAGWYRVGGLSAGTYFAVANGDEYAAEVYDALVCPAIDCDPAVGTPIEVRPPSTISGVDFELDRLGAFSGTVTAAQTGAPLADVNVEVRDDDNRRITSAWTDTDGHYRAGGLAAGTYFAVASRSDLADELYDGVLCPADVFSGCEPSAGRPIEVDLNATREGIDFALAVLGAVSGTVTDVTTGEPVFEAEVTVLTTAGDAITHDSNDESGHYAVSGLLPGEYLVFARSIEHAGELYRGVPCAAGLHLDCAPREGQPVEVRLDGVVSGIDFDLQRLGAITGTVTHAVTGEPLSDVFVEARAEVGDRKGQGRTDETGVYMISGLEEGLYTVHTSSNFLDEIHDGVACYDGCDPTLGTVVEVNRESTTARIDFALDSKGRVSGSVADRKTGAPLASLRVRLLPSGVVARTDEAGHYAFEGLLPATYFAFMENDRSYLGQLWADTDCFNDCDPLGGNPIEVVANSDVTRIDFNLDLGAVISGIVTETRSGAPIETHVAVTGASGYEIAGGDTDSTGRYEVGGLSPGDYFLRTYNGEGFIDETYDDVACRGECDLNAATVLTVDVGEVLTGFDFTLDRRGSLSGRVSDVRTGAPIHGAEVLLRDAEGELVSSDETDPAGRYTVPGLNPGVYFASTFNDDGFRDQTFDGVPCSFECRPADGTPIEIVADSKLTGIDFALERLGAISAAVTEVASGAAIEGIEIEIWDAGGDRISSARTDSDGLAAVGNLPPGTYFAATNIRIGYLDELYDELPCPRLPVTQCDPLKGTPIVVAVDSITEIRFALQRED